MGNDLKTSVIVDLKGNLARQVKRNEQAVSRFSRNSSRNLNGLGRSVKTVNKTFGSMGKKLAGIAAAAASIRSISKVIDFDAKLTRMQTDGRVTVKQIAMLKKELTQLANDPSIRLPKESIFAGFDQIIAMTGDFPNAMKNLRDMATFMQATGTAGKDAGTMISIAFKNGVTEASKVSSLMGVQYKQSKTGSVPIRELAATGKGLISPVTAVVGSTADVVTDATAMAQIIIDVTKNADMTAEALKAFMSALNKIETQEYFKKKGVDFRRPNSMMLYKPSELTPKIYDAVKGDFGILNKYFGESGVKVFHGFAKPANKKEGVLSGRERLRDLVAMTSDGSVIRQDARTNASTAKAALQSITNKVSDLSDQTFSQPTKDAADAMDNFQSQDAWTNAKAIGYAGASVPAWFVDWGLNSFNYVADLTVGTAIRELKTLFAEQPEAKVVLEVEAKNATVKTKGIESKNLELEVNSGKTMVTP